MSEAEPARLLQSLDRPVSVPSGLSAQIWEAVESELSGAPSVSGLPERPPIRRWKGPLVGSAAAAVVLLVGFATWAFLSPTDQPPVASTTPSPTTTLPAITSLPQAPTDVVVGTPDDGFADVIAALDRASVSWRPDEDFRYAFRVSVACECPDSGTRWVRIFQGPPEGDPWDVIPILSRIRTDIEAEPARVEVAFSPEDGHPTYYSVQWPEGSDADDLVLGVDGFHEIALTVSGFDRTWRFTSGVVDGDELGNPVTYGAIYLTLDSGFASFPVDCNTGGAMIDIHEGAFGAAPIATTDAGCFEYSSESELFVTGIERAETISEDGSELILSGPGVELRFVPPQQAESMGELPLTAAGETLLLEFPDGRSRGVIYTVADESRELGGYVQYLLTAEATGVDSVAGWQDWSGEFEVPDVVVTGPGPDRVVMPDTIPIGDYRLCSPYWEPDPLCFDLLVRPASAPWFVTAGADGVVLHDADGTSSAMSSEATAIAFYVNGALVMQAGEGTGLPLSPSGPIVVRNGGESSELPLNTGEVLLDVAVSDGRLLAVVSGRSGSTSTIDLDSGQRTVLGPSSIEARLHGDVALLRLSPDRLEARSLEGVLLWEMPIDLETMVVPADPGVMRLDRFGDLYTDSDPAYRQFVETRLIDLATGEELDSYQREVAIPLEGDEITDRCLRPELRDGLMLCPQPDGRMTTLEIEGGGTFGFPAGHGGIATYVRLES